MHQVPQQRLTPYVDLFRSFTMFEFFLVLSKYLATAIRLVFRMGLKVWDGNKRRNFTPCLDAIFSTLVMIKITYRAVIKSYIF